MFVIFATKIVNVMTEKNILRVGLKGQKNQPIGGEWCSFERGEKIDRVIELFDPDCYPPEQRELIEEFNHRARIANDRYRMARHREDMLSNGFEAGMYICTFDRDENMLSFEFTDGTRRMLGYEGLEDLPNEFDSWVKTLLPEERDAIVPIFWQTVRHHRELPDISHAEYRMLRKDGRIIWVTGAGKFIRREDDGSLEIYMGCYRDVTAEYEKSAYLHIIEGVGKVFNFSLYITIPDASYRIISTNKYVTRVKVDEDAFVFLRNNVNESVHPDFRSELNDWIQQDAILSQLEHQESIMRDFMSDVEGGEFWFRATFMVADRNEDGSIAHLIYGCQDITQAKQDEIRQQQQLEEARQQAEAANKAKTAFLFNMSHDIRTPMNAILGFANLISHETDNTPLMLDHLEKITNSGKYLLALINDVLDMARIESGKAVVDNQVYKVDDPSNDATRMFEEEARMKHITLTATMDIQHNLIMADKMKLHQIVVNILSNALKYTLEGGSVKISITEMPSEREGYAKYVTRCQDTGIGMTPEFAEHIFDLFSRERNTTTSGVMGAGLGMSIVKRLVTLLGGTIEIETAPGKGSTFIVTLWHKIVSNYDEAAIGQQSDDKDVVLEGKRVLLVEDNALNAEIAQVILEEMGLKVDLAEDGVVCINKLCAEAPGYYDVILMDIQMPRLNGYDTARHIRALEDKGRAGVPIVAMTANAFDEDKRMALQAGMNAHLAKPIEVGEIAKTLSALLASRGARVG